MYVLEIVNIIIILFIIFDFLLLLLCCFYLCPCRKFHEPLPVVPLKVLAHNELVGRVIGELREREGEREREREREREHSIESIPLPFTFTLRVDHPLNTPSISSLPLLRSSAMGTFFTLL